MKVSTKGRYALRLMLDLALNNTGEYIKIKNISERQEVSEKYLEQIVTALSKSGYVKSVRGAQGGYKLAFPPEKYTVGMILRLTEGSLSPVACIEDETECGRIDECITIEVWKRLDEAIKGVVDSITLADLVDWQMKKINNNYYI